MKSNPSHLGVVPKHAEPTVLLQPRRCMLVTYIQLNLCHRLVVRRKKGGVENNVVTLFPTVEKCVV